MFNKQRILTVIGISLLLLIACAIWFYRTSIPPMEGEILLPGLRQPVVVGFDDFANPTISADSKADAYFTLGYLTTRERLFQMDLMRRKTAGRLSEVLGKATLKLDIANRHNGFTKAVANILQSLPEKQRNVLQAYADGVNAYLKSDPVLPIEFIVLGYQPEAWRIEDSLLISLSMFQMLNINDQNERMITVMRKVLPDDVVAFLTPEDDFYNPSVLLQGEDDFDTSSLRIPEQSLLRLNVQNGQKYTTGLTGRVSDLPGSNQWVVNKHRNGGALLANDMHLPLAVPNLWYQATLKYADVNLTGISLPGMPLIIAGSNGTIAWGFTNAQGDVLDLVKLTMNPENDRQYKSSQGWRDFEVYPETISVKGEEDYPLRIKWTEWGPVSSRLLMGQEVAMQWSIFYPEAVDMALLDMDKIREMQDALTLFKNAGLPVLNVMLADSNGHIAWTLTGKIPERVNFDGSTSLPRDDGKTYWTGFVPPEQYPDVIDPPSGILVSANNRVLAQQHGFVYGQNFVNSYRAFRIKELLNAETEFTQETMHAIQLDARSGFYDFYQQVALSALTADNISVQPDLLELKTAIAGWDGFAHANSKGFGLLVEFRLKLADIIFSSYVQRCRKIDIGFRYSWFQMDTPLRFLLSHQLSGTLPGNGRYRAWNELILDALMQVADENIKRFPQVGLDELKWGEMSKIELKHPFSHAFPWLGTLLDMPEQPLSGCTYCVRVASKNFGASMRMVISPGYEEQMILHEPTGQSGIPFSPNYRDKYPYWVSGVLVKKPTRHVKRRLTLFPEK